MLAFLLPCAHTSAAPAPAPAAPAVEPEPAPPVALALDDPGLSPAVLAATATFGETPFFWPPDDGVWWGTPDDSSDGYGSYLVVGTLGQGTWRGEFSW